MKSSCNVTNFQIIRFILLFSLFILRLKNLVIEHGGTEGLYISLLEWSFFVICLPVARGTIIFGFLLSKTKYTKFIIPEMISWSTALAINFFSLLQVPNIYFSSTITHLLYHILTNPMPYIIIPTMCCIATFYTALYCNKQNKNLTLKKRSICTLLIFCAFAITFLFSYNNFIIILNAHGS